MKKSIAFILCLFAPVLLSGCKGHSPAAAQIANPFIECQTVTEAEAEAGFEFQLPSELPSDFSGPQIRAVKDTLVELIYTSSDTRLCLRKGIGNQDISGDYREYSDEETVNDNGLSITFKGNEGKMGVAVWSDSDYTYSVTADSGLDKEVLLNIIHGFSE